jgi:hypothetical protein
MEMDHHHPDSGGSSATAARRCAACKYLRRRCAPDCVLAPYFPASQPRRYADVHAVFGTSNVTRVLQVRRACSTSAVHRHAHLMHAWTKPAGAGGAPAPLLLLS